MIKYMDIYGTSKVPCPALLIGGKADPIYFSYLKGHGNEADFLGFLQKLGSHRSLTLPFEPFRF
jgi:hypothetical protein